MLELDSRAYAPRLATRAPTRMAKYAPLICRVVATVAVLATSACAADWGTPEEEAWEDESVAETEAPLINGALVPDDRFRSALLLWPASMGQSHCPAVRVGPRQILTAAHCVVTESTDQLILLIPVASRRLPGAAWGPIYRAWM